MVFSSRDGIFLEVNDSYCQMTGRTKKELVGHDRKLFTYPEDIGISEEVNKRINSGETDQVRYSKRFLHKNGRIVVAGSVICSARDEGGERALFRLFGTRYHRRTRARYPALLSSLHDPLTGLANRALFDDRLVQPKRE